ncbi:MAG: prolyl oligopeptidase family serine peptidase [Gemmatimonadales bacterium]|nr:prolyl oligopeptidase family serine peptidase [Gemmatimonadales bacterium]NIN12538.1 prolyl oligopeptidase family serine peptidase [Gemmatimonadales bacterium]NIR00856.1 prolyl oligopeptidase family serine peptidase [Gemmatimonadales bacterium]
MRTTNSIPIWCTAALALALPTGAGSAQDEPANRFKPIDVFQLEYAADPQISPDGQRIVYVRNFMDIMKDRRWSNLWIINYDGTGHRPLTTGNHNYFSPRWSPDGTRLLYASSEDGSSQLYVRWMDTGETAKVTNLTRSPSGIAWSPDGQWIAFSMMVPQRSAPFAQMPAKPDGADWGPPIQVIDKVRYRADGQGYLESGYRHLFVLPAEGGTPRQVTTGSFNHGGTPTWTPDSKALVFSANRHEDWEYDPRNSEIHEVSLADGSITTLTDRQGPDGSPAVSPDGQQIAYLGYDDRYQGYQLTRLYVMRRDGSESKLITGEFDRRVQRPVWARDGRGIYFQYDDQGNTKIGYVSLRGEVQTLAGDVGGLSLGRPYSGGIYTVAPNGRFAFTYSRPDHPADVAVGRRGSSEISRLTALNDDLLGHKELGEIEEIWYESSFDGRQIHGWILKPPGFDPQKKYPLILEIHGGPFANYGDRFAAEIQLYAAAGYVVLYANPRGSSSYGEEFGNLIHHAYPSQDFDDLMSGVDAVISRGYVDESQLFVTGGSGGGVLSSWIVGHTDRFRAAVVQKPVINWYSFVLTADNSVSFYKYWFPGFPWEHLDHYMSRSPLSYVGNVTTPTMLITGEVDYRTPMSETEQFYQALKLRKVPTAMVRIPDASHGIAARPSNLIAKVVHILKWFEKYRAMQS